MEPDHNQGAALDPAQGIKPLDFGHNGLTGSVSAQGRLIALNAYHPQHGIITLTGAAPFTEAQRYDPAAVRRYRASLAALTGFGPQFEAPVTGSHAALVADALPQITLTLAGGATVLMSAWAVNDGAAQRWVWRTDESPRWRGSLSLQRAAYTQLTEGGPLPMPDTITEARLENGILTITNPALPAAAAIAGFDPGLRWQHTGAGPVAVDLPGTPQMAVLRYGFGLTRDEAIERAEHVAQRVAYGEESARRYWSNALSALPDDRMVRRGLSYGLMLCVPVGESTAILTDHMLLPLSWNRDAYYVARLLLSVEPRQTELVRRHLLWMFETAQRLDDSPGGLWGRCYLANGRIKDAAFQLDQQLFPLLELAEYTRETGDTTLWQRLRPAVEILLHTLFARHAPGLPLLPTDETPADDPVALPYHLSSHILLWVTLRRLSELPDPIPLPVSPADVREAIRQHFITTHNGEPIYAYATDGAGNHHLYHDANDVPLLLAPLWGFTPLDDPEWRRTVDFAFSAANTGGMYDGRLGSVHTPAPWPLGDIQDWLAGRLLGDAAREQRAYACLQRAAQWDGALPEATESGTGRVVSRHWFAWPNALLAGLILGAYGSTQGQR